MPLKHHTSLEQVFPVGGLIRYARPVIKLHLMNIIVPVALLVLLTLLVVCDSADGTG